MLHHSNIFSNSSSSTTSSYSSLFKTLRMHRAALSITAWWQRRAAFRVLAERAQRRIAPVWRGAWVRMRLKKARKNNGDDLFDFEIPEGVDEDTEKFLNEASKNAQGGAGRTIVEVLRERIIAREKEEEEEKAKSKVVFSGKIPTPPPTTMASSSQQQNSNNLFVIRNHNNNRPFSPIPPTTTTTSKTIPQTARSNTPNIVNNANGVLNQQQVQQRASSASIVQQQQQQSQQQNEGAEGGGEWSAAITDLLKYRDRKRAAAKQARERQEFFKGSGLTKK